MNAAQASDDAAFARLVAEHQQAVRGFLRRLGGSHADADDLAQDTFIAAWSRPDAARQARDMRAWLCGVAYKKWLSRYRSDSRRRSREAEAQRDADSPASADPNARLDAATLLGALPTEQRAAVALCLAGGFSHDEAARALGLPLGTVKSHVARGRAKLLTLLGDADDRS